MIIPSHKINAYLPKIQFPVKILQERGEQVAMIATEAQLNLLISERQVIAIGSWSRIRHLRMNQPYVNRAATPTPAMKITFTVPIAEDNRTITRERLTFSHNLRHCYAYNPVGRVQSHAFGV